jgi:hypothetical protein
MERNDKNLGRGYDLHWHLRSFEVYDCPIVLWEIGKTKWLYCGGQLPGRLHCSPKDLFCSGRVAIVLSSG